VAEERDLVAPEAVGRLEAMAARRLEGEPVARILGDKEFWGLSFGLNRATLVPRPETEMLVEAGLLALASRANPTLSDLGTGTGAIPIALLSERADLSAVAVDLSAEALEMAAQNAARHGVAARLRLLHGSWFEPVADLKFDLITANPPYIETAALAGLMVDVRDHDPALALDGGVDGLDPYRVIVPLAPRHLRPGGVLLVEIGTGQGADVAALFREAGFSAVTVSVDLNGHERVVSGYGA
jgi:release factor glutamine methyltransferase